MKRLFDAQGRNSFSDNCLVALRRKGECSFSKYGILGAKIISHCGTVATPGGLMKSDVKYARAVVISKSFSKGGARCNYVHILGLA